jgi:copper chaperone
MITFEVIDMTCAHCVGAITKAVQAIDPAAIVRIELASHRVDVDPGEASPAQLLEAIQQAGYTPVEKPDASKAAADDERR